MRDVISTSDEAIIAWFFYAKSNDWKEQVLKKRSKDSGSNESVQEGAEKIHNKNHASREKLMYYFQQKTRVAELIDPTNEIESTGWDEAIEKEENKEWEESQKGKKCGHEEEDETEDEDGENGKKSKNSLAEIIPGYNPAQISYDPCKPVEV